MPDMSYTSRDYEDLIEKISGILDCQVFVDDDGNIEEIHVVARPGRARTHIVRDVQSVLVAACGVKVDSRKISVVHIGEYPPERGIRPRLASIELISGECQSKVRIKLGLEETLVVGEAEGVSSPTRWNWLCAEAVTNALRELFREDVMVSIMDVRVVESGRLRTALIILQVSEGGKEMILSGSCPILYDEREAVAKATLDAINRRFPLLSRNT